MADVKVSTPSESILGFFEVLENRKLWRMLLAEFIGTLLLVAIGCGSCAHAPTLVQIAFTFGLTVAAVVQAIGHISGGHINPAVTISFFVTGDINLVRAIFYIIVQILGAIAGAGLLKLLIPGKMANMLGVTQVAEPISPIFAILFEFLFTFVLVLVIHSVCDRRRHDIKGSVPLIIGVTVVAVHLCGIPFTGSSMNPARSLGPAVIMNSWKKHYVYWAGPIVGGILAGLFYKYVLKVKKGDNDSYDF